MCTQRPSQSLLQGGFSPPGQHYICQVCAAGSLFHLLSSRPTHQFSAHRDSSRHTYLCFGCSSRSVVLCLQTLRRQRAGGRRAMRCTPSGWHPVLSASYPASSGYKLASSQVLLPLMNGCSKMWGWSTTTMPSSGLLHSWTACGCRSLGNDWSLADAVSLSYELQSEAGCSRYGGCTPSYAWSWL